MSQVYTHNRPDLNLPFQDDDILEVIRRIRGGTREDDIVGLKTTYKDLKDAIVAEAAGGGGGAYQTITVELTPAQILALDTTPVVLIPAQGAGLAILPIFMSFYMDFNSVGYTSGTSNGVTIQNTGDTMNYALFPTNYVTQTSTKLQTITNEYATAYGIEAPVGEGIQIKSFDTFAAGDSNVKVSITYQVLDLN